jgi:hypothetical protein
MTKSKTSPASCCFHVVVWLQGLILLAACAPFFTATLRAEEIWLCDNSRLYGIVAEAGADGTSIKVLLPDDSARELPLAEIIAITFRGRPPAFLQSGTQEFHFVSGGSLRGEVLGFNQNALCILTNGCGAIETDTKNLQGFLGLPLTGLAGRRAEEMLQAPVNTSSPSLDTLIDNRGSTYPGVIKRVDRANLTLDHEDFLRDVSIAFRDLAGLRLADAARKQPPAHTHDVRLRVSLRDGSRFDGALEKIHLGAWTIRPLWEEKAALTVEVSEIVSVLILNGRVQYLSQLTPVKISERTGLSPPQRFHMDQTCDGRPLMIGSRTFPWGIGVHADSELSFKTGGIFKEFRSTAGVDARMAGAGSVVFAVLGDSKPLFKSPVIRGGNAPVEVIVAIAGVQELVLKVSDAEDNDLSDMADWGAARIVR